MSREPSAPRDVTRFHRKKAKLYKDAEDDDKDDDDNFDEDGIEEKY